MEGESARVSRASECELDLKTTDEPQSSSARVASIDAPVDTTHYKSMLNVHALATASAALLKGSGGGAWVSH